MTKKVKTDPPPPPIKRQKVSADAGSGSNQENQERCNLSRQAQSRHRKNDIRAMIRAKLPGPGKLSENSIMLQAAERIKELEIRVNFAADYLESLQKLQRDNETIGDKLINELSNKDQNAPAGSSHGGSDLIPAGQQEVDGHVKLRAVLPQPTNSKGTRLLALAVQNITELEGKLSKLETGITEVQRSLGAPSMETNSAPNQQQLNHHTAKASAPKDFVQIPSLHATPTFGEKATVVGQPAPQESLVIKDKTNSRSCLHLAHSCSTHDTAKQQFNHQPAEASAPKGPVQILGLDTTPTFSEKASVVGQSVPKGSLVTEDKQ